MPPNDWKDVLKPESTILIPMNDIKLIEYCAEKYERNERCMDCPNGDCQGSCDECLRKIHFNEIKRRYNCTNIVNCYVCKHLPRYLSEIYHLFESNPWLNQLGSFRILSIGCGPCSDLFGIARWMRDNEKENVSITYLGCDLNEIWADIHSKIKKLAIKSEQEIKCKIIGTDAFSLFRAFEEKWPGEIPFNILTLQYVMSDMVSNEEEIIKFFKRLRRYIIGKMPSGSVVIINDINYEGTRKYYWELLSILREKGAYKCKTYHFPCLGQKYYPFGTEHLNVRLVQSPPEIANDFNVWKECRSSQMVIKKS